MLVHLSSAGWEKKAYYPTYTRFMRTYGSESFSFGCRDSTSLYLPSGLARKLTDDHCRNQSARRAAAI